MLTPETEGPVVLQVEAGPPRFHVMAPEGAVEPVTPVTTAVNLIGDLY